MSRIIQYINEVRAEFKNITWPKKDALIQLTIVVISFSVVVSLILGGFDYIFTNSLSLLGNTNKPNAAEQLQESQVSLPTDASTVDFPTSTPSSQNNIKK